MLTVAPCAYCFANWREHYPGKATSFRPLRKSGHSPQPLTAQDIKFSVLPARVGVR
jgi:hypothetical protein